MNPNEEALLAGLKALAASETRAPSPQIEAALLKQLNRRKVISWPVVFGAIAAAVIIAIGLNLAPRPAPETAEFMAVPYSEPLSPYERREVVRVNVPVSALAAWGMRVVNDDPYRRVNADVVLGEDGLARAVRLVSSTQ